MIKEHITHYKKIKLNDDISLRYFYSFEDKPNFNRKWVIKSHSLKKYSIIDRNAVELILKLYNKNIDKYKEIRGKVTKKGYEKLVIKPNGKIKIHHEETQSD